ncbi:hypothetical protein CR513_29218, partial [Mucuna pruriens]
MSNARWTEQLDEALERIIRFPDIPLLGTQGAINYNPKLTFWKVGYPMIRAHPEEIITLFRIHDSEAHSGEHHRRIRHTWKNLRDRVRQIRLPGGKTRRQDSETQAYETLEVLKTEELQEALEQMKSEQGSSKRKLEATIIAQAFAEEEAKRVSLLEEEGARARLYKEHLEGQRRQGLVELVKARGRAIEAEQQAQTTIQELEKTLESWKQRCEEMADTVEEHVRVTEKEVAFWKD